MTSKQKNIIYVVAFIVVLIMCYKLAISNTLELKNTYQELKAEETIFESLPKEMNNLKQKKVYYDSILKKYSLHESSFQNNLLATLNEFAEKNNVKIVDFLAPHIFKYENYTDFSYQFKLQGNYNDMLRLIYEIETQYRFGEIAHLSFEKKKDFKRNKNFLEASVILKNYTEN